MNVKKCGSGAEPSQFYDPLAPFPLGQPAGPTQATLDDRRAHAHAPAAAPAPPTGWYYADDYNAVYGQRTPVPGKFKLVGKTATAQQCQAVCAADRNCPIFAWSDQSNVCWLRLDHAWGSPETLHKEGGRISGCRLGSNASSGAPLVPGCGTNPVAPHTPNERALFYYGGEGNNIGKPTQNGAPSSILPVLTRIDAALDTGITLAQSPEDTPIVAFATAAAADHSGAGAGAGAGSAGAWLNWTRRYHRFGGQGGSHEASPTSFAAGMANTGKHTHTHIYIYIYIYIDIYIYMLTCPPILQVVNTMQFQ